MSSKLPSSTMYKVFALAAGIFVAQLPTVITQGVCESDSSCIPLIECPELLKLLQPPSRDSIRRLQQLTCLVDRRKPKVCCPVPTTEIPIVSTTIHQELNVTAPETELPHRNTDLLPDKCGRPQNYNNIVGGTVVELGELPWMAALGYVSPSNPRTRYLCGGSLINNRYVLTAAHCVHSAHTRGMRLVEIRLGDHDLDSNKDCNDKFCSPPPQIVSPEEIVQHPNFTSGSRTPTSDIALIRLDRQVEITGWVSPICLPAPGAVLPLKNSNEAQVAGWGATEFGPSSSSLLKLTVPAVPQEECAEKYPRGISSHQVCYGGAADKDSCSGDSGGPLMVEIGSQMFIQIGLVSYGYLDCGREGVPAVYTDITAFRTWILDNLKP